MSKKYIAYGSNLSVRQMAHRCPDARIIGMAAIQDWKRGAGPDLGNLRTR